MAKKSYTVISNIIVYVLLLLLLTGTIGFFLYSPMVLRVISKLFISNITAKKLYPTKTIFP